MEISGTLRNIANGEMVQQNTTVPPQSLDEFQPTTGTLLVNLSWFISLSLSVMVALVASLVKQWCNSFLSDRTAPPCNQARIRQARLNKLISWRTELIVAALPVIMHAALGELRTVGLTPGAENYLGLFLFGLIVFLRDLNHLIYTVVLFITAATGLFYIGTTILPLFIPFCPYETPLSSLKVWGYCYQLCLAMGSYVYGMLTGDYYKADFTNHISPCEQKELMTSYNTSPDDVTGHSLTWIITHSQRSETREMAVRTISGLKSESTLRELIVGAPRVFPQVIQSFTSCFQVGPRSQVGENELKLKKGKSVEIVFLHVQALITLINLVLQRTCDRMDVGPEYLATWGVDSETVKAVKKRLHMWVANTVVCMRMSSAYHEHP